LGGRVRDEQDEPVVVGCVASAAIQVP
jgi:hypothetical protein